MHLLQPRPPSFQDTYPLPNAAARPSVRRAPSQSGETLEGSPLSRGVGARTCCRQAEHRVPFRTSAFLLRSVCALRPPEAILYGRWGLPQSEDAAVAPFSMLERSSSTCASLTGRMRPSETTILRRSMLRTFLMNAPLGMPAVCGLFCPPLHPSSAPVLASTHVNRRL